MKEAYEDEVTAKEERDTSEKEVKDRAAAELVSALCQTLGLALLALQAPADCIFVGVVLKQRWVQPLAMLWAINTLPAECLPRW